MMQEQESLFPPPFKNLAIQIAQYQIQSISHAGQSMTMISSIKKKSLLLFDTFYIYFSHALLELSDAKEEGIEIRILALFRLKFLREVTKERDAQTKDLESYLISASIYRKVGGHTCVKMECKAYSRYFTSNFFLLKESSPQGSLNSPGIKWDREIVVHSVVGPPPNKYLPRIGPVSSSGTESQRTVEFSNSSIIIGFFFISRIALEPGHTFLPEFQQQTKYVIVENEFSQHRRVCVLFIFT